MQVELPGRVSQDELSAYFRAADVFIFPSQWEGYGIAIEEAMCFGLPVVAYNAGSVAELVEDGTTGWLVAPDDLAALTEAVRECVQDIAERERRGKAGLEKARLLTEGQDLGKILEEAIAAASCAN